MVYPELGDARAGAPGSCPGLRPLAAEAYPRYGGAPLRALGSRCGALEHCLHTPPWNAAWYAKEARRWGVDVAVYVPPHGCSLVSGVHFIREALARVGVPLLELPIDPVSPTGGSRDAVLSHTACSTDP